MKTVDYQRGIKREYLKKNREKSGEIEIKNGVTITFFIFES